MHPLKPFLFLGILLLLSGCVPDPKSPRGFRLPDGDPERGQATFVELQCHGCHHVASVNLEPPAEVAEELIALGGEVAKVQTYGDLVTSIINPSHRLAAGYPQDEVAREDGVSRMKNYNDVMTIQQLIDLVAFLQSHYQVVLPEPTPYPTYYP